MPANFNTRIPNEDHKLACENPDCNRKDRPLYVFHGDNGEGSMLLCDICMVKTVRPTRNG